MKNEYKAYVPHGITFGDKHTWRDWRLVPTSRPVFQPPDVKRIEIDLTGGDGIVDLTESLTGDVRYKQRTGSMEFQVENKEQWTTVYSDILDYLHGQKMKAVLDDDLGYYYMGRFSVNQWKSDKMNSKIVIDYSTDPYKYDMFGSADEWLWDSFNFETGIIRDYYRNLPVETGKTTSIFIPGERKPVVPEFDVILGDGVDSIKVRTSTNGKTYTLKAGKNRIPSIVIRKDGATFYFTGAGTVTINYRGGRL